MPLSGSSLTPVTAATPATRAPAATADSRAARSHGPSSLGPWLFVGAAVAWNLLTLRAETLAVPYLDDSSVHEQMVRFATAQLRAGHLPLDSWFPFLSLGSPQFLHYQGLPAMLAGLAGLLIGPDVAFRWTLYLLLSLWPVSVYVCARLFGARRSAAAAARRDVAVSGQRDRDRLRAERLRLDWVRRLDPTVGIVHAATRLGVQLARDP